MDSMDSMDSTDSLDSLDSMDSKKKSLGWDTAGYRILLKLIVEGNNSINYI